MLTLVLIVHLIIAVALIGVVLLQQSEGGALGIGGGGGGGMAGFMTGRSTANLLTRTTAVLAAVFFSTSIALAIMAAHQRAPHSILDITPPSQPTAPSEPTAPVKPSANPQAPGATPLVPAPAAPRAAAPAPSAPAPSAAAPASPAVPTTPSAPLVK